MISGICHENRHNLKTFAGPLQQLVGSAQRLLVDPGEVSLSPGSSLHLSLPFLSVLAVPVLTCFASQTQDSQQKTARPLPTVGFEAPVGV